MKRTFATIFAASAMTLCPARAKTHDITDQARNHLRDIEFTARDIAIRAENLDSPTSDWHPSAVYQVELEVIKEQINRAGRELHVLDTQRAALLPWEERAMEQANALMADAARNESRALRFYNENGRRPLTSEFRGYLAKVESDTSQAAKLLREHLELDQAKATEQKIERILGE